MGGMLTEVQQTLGENPLYRGLNFAGQDIKLTQPVFHDLAVKVINWADAHGGHMPTGTQPLGHFSDWLRWRWDTALLSGHENRFDSYHCPTLVATIERDYVLSIVPPPSPPAFVPPTTVIPTTTPLHPIVPPTDSPDGPGHPTQGHPFNPPDHGAVPEPASVSMMSISIVAMGLIWLIFCIGRKTNIAIKS